METKAMPRHVAITMDGNGRWAVERGRPRTFGHHRGAERVREVVRRASDIGIEALTLFAFSSENWRRPDYEVKVLMRLFKRYIVREVDGLDAEGVQVRFIGDRNKLPADLVRVMEMMEARTADNDGMVLQLAISYGSRAEMLQGVKALVKDVADGILNIDDIDEAAFSASLHTAGVPDPDLMIRTSGEYRISNFLLWQAAYAEFAFIDECWPDFTPDRLEELVMTFGTRERRFGAVKTG